MKAHGSLLGDLLPHVGGVDLPAQPRVLVGQLAAVARVDAIGAVVGTAVLAGDSAGDPAVIAVGHLVGQPAEEAEDHHAGDGGNASRGSVTDGEKVDTPRHAHSGHDEECDDDDETSHG